LLDKSLTSWFNIPHKGISELIIYKNWQYFYQRVRS